MIDLDFATTLDSAFVAAGTVYGIGDASFDDYYLDGLAEDAHSVAAWEFDLMTASVANASSGYLNHVYEFGVPGITRGPARVSDPTSPAARLWVHDMQGSHGVYEIDYAFRPAIVPNPQPTTAYTGVPSKYLRKLSKRKYVFYNKALVMETGSQVEIRAKNGEFLFVPFYGEESSNPFNKRGYMMWHYPTRGPIITNPGQATAGTFTAHFESFFETRGMDIMEGRVGANIYSDVQEVLRKAEAAAAAQRLEPVTVTDGNKVASNARKVTKKNMQKKSVPRKKNKRR